MDDKETKGQSRGGVERARRLSPERRAEIAHKAAITRWVNSGSVPLAKYGSPDRPLRIGSAEIPCYVLADGRRVLTQKGTHLGFGLSDGGGKDGSRKIATLMGSLEGKGIHVRGLVDRANSPVRFYMPHGGKMAEGYEASILPDICAVLIQAGLDGKLTPRQQRLAERAAMLQHGFAEVGINALVDEVTGYQADREIDGLARILARFIAKELRPWVRTFPAEFYEQIYRLRGWEWKGMSVNRTQALAHYTKDIVYARLAPGVLEELNRIRIERQRSGKPKAKMFQHLTEDWGHPKLKEHLSAACALLRISATWEGFMDVLDRALPRYGETLKLLPPDPPAPKLLTETT